jgi:hypothetical protein
MTGPSSTQLGAIAENLVANALMVESGGRLSPFSPQADDDGIDLLIYDKETGRALPAQIKSRTLTLKKRASEERGDIVHFEVRRATFRAERYAVAILVLTADSGYRIDTAWVVPLEQLDAGARQGETKLIARPSRSATSQDRWAKYRCSSPAQLCERVMAILAATPVVRSPARDV